MRGVLSTVLAAGLSLTPAVLGAALKARDEVPEPIEGYRGPIPIGNATINAPLDENGKETYIGKPSDSPLLKPAAFTHFMEPM